ncbi:predicted protein [Histoplasma capsulatum H143]|uniref:Uncharacterized protein n=1 Tax=Ajellomyces capsulatus (strain H143) TaxID=544712 RepID=C6H4Z1_AJECH|nr:predicted protein [Histoplasma capsulatum H143]
MKSHFAFDPYLHPILGLEPENKRSNDPDLTHTSKLCGAQEARGEYPPFAIQAKMEVTACITSKRNSKCELVQSNCELPTYIYCLEMPHLYCIGSRQNYTKG